MAEAESPHFLKAVAELGEKRPVAAARAIYNTQGLKVIDKGVAIDARLYERLQQHQLSAGLADSVTTASPIGSRQLREAAEAVLAREPFFARLAGEGRGRELLLDSFDAMPLPPAVAFQLTLAHEVRPALFDQSVRSALVAAWLVSTPMTPRFDIAMLCAGGLLHDLGMLRIDPVLSTPQQELNAEQRRQLYSHPLLSAMLLERHHEFPRTLLRAVLEHHECVDGSGYPRGLAGDALSPWGRVLSLAQTVSAMFEPGRDAPELRLSVLLRMNPRRYDGELMRRVTTLLRPKQPEGNVAAARLAEPGGVLTRIDGILAGWEAAVLQAADTPERQAWLAPAAAQCEQLRRTLADSGVAPEQLALLAGQPEDAALHLELALMAREAAWQLRSLTRQTRRCWRLGADDVLPDACDAWLASSELIFQPLLHGNAGDATPPPA